MEQEFTPQQYRNFNGQSIMLALETMGGSATADDLAQHIGVLIEQPQQLVKPEVMQVLRRGISNGFFQRKGRHYFLVHQDIAYQVDSKRKQKAHLPTHPIATNGSRKRIRFSPRNAHEKETELDKDELEEQSIAGLLEIILKENEETQRATVLATNAAKRAKLASTKIQEIIDNEGVESENEGSEPDQ